LTAPALEAAVALAGMAVNPTIIMVVAAMTAVNFLNMVASPTLDAFWFY
jgi:hypothetical protein